MSLSLRVLGTASPYPLPGNPCSAYLVDADGVRILVEIGLGCWPELLRVIPPEELDAIWVSHLHPDHSGDLLAAYQWIVNTPRAPRIPVFGPPGWAERIGAALPVEDGAAQLRRLFQVYDHDGVRDHDGGRYRVAGVDLRAVAVAHSVPSYGLRLSHRGAVLAYSGDTGPCPALAELAAGADVFLCEAGSETPGQPYHCAPEEAHHAGMAARRTILTHLHPNLTPMMAERRAPGAQVATPGMVLTVRES